MKPKTTKQHVSQLELFKTELVDIIAPLHPLVQLAKAINWVGLDKCFGSSYCPVQGRPGIPTRLMVALNYLKYLHDLSDEGVLSGWSSGKIGEGGCRNNNDPREGVKKPSNRFLRVTFGNRGSGTTTHSDDHIYDGGKEYETAL